MSDRRASLAELLADLNEPQRQAVQHRDGPLLVLAGPGSGKTRVITRRAAHLVLTGAAPWQVLAITFTNKAAAEMRRRIEDLGVGRGMWVCTFHALGVRLLREWGELGGVKPGFSIYDESDQLALVKEAMALCQVGERLIDPHTAHAMIGSCKNALQLPADVAKEAEGESLFERAFARVYDAYQQLLTQRNAVDFDDLILRIAVVLNENESVSKRMAERFRYVLIDEYQDTNRAQYLIANRIAQHHRNICSTGDPDQSIYSWRGADLRNILEFERDYPDATIVRLEQNYRSHGNILRVADALIAHNHRRKKKTLWTEDEDGAPVTVWRFREGRDEAEQVAETIRRLADDESRAWSDFAVFYRVNAVSRGLEEALRARGIPYKIARGLEFYNRREIKDALAYLRVLVNPADRIALRRIINTPTRGIGEKSIEKLEDAAIASGRTLFDVLRSADSILSGKLAGKMREFVHLLDELQALVHGPVSAAVQRVLERSGLERALREEVDVEGEDRLANVQELVSAAVRYEEEIDEPSLADFLNRISLTSDQDAVDEQAGVVLLMTLHAAKGLEFPIVFVVGLEQGMLPHERALRGDGDLEEERRLCFVGVTRAMRRLFLSRAAERVIRGQWMPRPASQFLSELPDADGVIQSESFTTDDASWTSGFTRFGGGARPPAPDARARRREDALEHGEYPPDWDEFDDSEDDDAVDPNATIRATEPDDSDPGELPARLDNEPASRDASRRPRTKPGARPLRTRRDEPVYTRDDPTGRRPPAPSESFADWAPQMFVMHKDYGVGQIEWIKPAAGLTRASIRFPGHGQKLFILEHTPVTRLERR